MNLKFSATRLGHTVFCQMDDPQNPEAIIPEKIFAVLNDDLDDWEKHTFGSLSGSPTITEEATTP